MQRNQNKTNKKVFSLAASSLLVITSLLSYNNYKANAAIADNHNNIATMLGRIFGNENETKQAGVYFEDYLIDVCQPSLPQKDGTYINKPLKGIDDGVYKNKPSRDVDDSIYLIPQCANHNVA